jgi:hypothetical protein
VHHGRVVKGTGDGAIVEFRSVVDAVNCAIEVQRAMVERNAEVAPDRRIEFRVGDPRLTSRGAQHRRARAHSFSAIVERAKRSQLRAISAASRTIFSNCMNARLRSM